MKIFIFFVIICANLLPLSAYVGPGAGFAFAGSFLFIFAAFFVAVYSFLTFPIRILIKFIKRTRTLKSTRFKKVVVVGFDGMDYNLLNRFMKEGKDFPNFSRLAQTGTFAPLLSTEPPISPVAWSTFSTGVNPGKHNIFDFLTVNRKNYLPELSCSEILPPKRNLNIGKFAIPLSKPKIELKRKSKSFWQIVGSKGLFSSVLRVPYTFPPEKFYGTMLSGLGTPDLRGAQGSFTFYSDHSREDFDIADGVYEQLEKISDDHYQGYIRGPQNPFRKKKEILSVKFKLKINREAESATLSVGRNNDTIKKGELTDWHKIEFRAGLIKIKGIYQWFIKSLDPLEIYLSPLNIDPESPSMPISHPKIFSVYLSKLLGSYATLGMAEDTWALEEGIITEEAFIQQTYKFQLERERAFFETLNKYKTGLVVQVFEATDRIQHMFWRYLKDSGSRADQSSTSEVVIQSIYRVYQAMDNLLGRLLKKLKGNELLLIVSDHGFNSVVKEFQLNTWLYENGYIVLKDQKTESAKWYADVDWSKSRAYTVGLNGIALNLEGREKNGIVKPGKEEENLKEEIKAKLKEVIDPEGNKKVFCEVYKREEIYQGPYTRNAPDIIVGYNLGFRVSWESAVNMVGDDCIKYSKRLWSGDHCFSNKLVRGIFFSNQKIEEQKPRLLDISPTVLSAFGIQQPAFIEGRNLLPEQEH